MVKADFDIYLLKTDYLPTLKKQIRSVILLFCFVAMEASFKLHQIVLQTTASIRKTKHNRDMVPDLIILLILFETYLSVLQCL